MTEELEEIILAFKLAGISMPNYQVLEDGSVYIYYGSKETDYFLLDQVSGIKDREIARGSVD